MIPTLGLLHLPSSLSPDTHVPVRHLCTTNTAPSSLYLLVSPKSLYLDATGMSEVEGPLARGTAAARKGFAGDGGGTSAILWSWKESMRRKTLS